MLARLVLLSVLPVLAVLTGGCMKSFLETFPVGTYENHGDQDTRHTWMCVTNVKGVLLRTDPLNFKGTRYVIESYDRDGDGQPDMGLVYGFVGNGGQLFPFPDRYIVKEKDGIYEFVDINGDGRCRSIRAVVGNPDHAEPNSPAQPRKQYPKEEIMPGEDGEECNMEDAPSPKEQANGGSNT